MRKTGKSDRIAILKQYVDSMPVIFKGCIVINVCIDKTQHQKKDIFTLAWERLHTVYDIYLKNEVKDLGIVVCDDTESKKLSALQRQLNKSGNNIIEDAFHRSSNDSYFIQSVDVISHLLYRKE